MPEIGGNTARVLFMSNREQQTGKMSGIQVMFHVRKSEKREFIHRPYLILIHSNLFSSSNDLKK